MHSLDKQVGVPLSLTSFKQQAYCMICRSPVLHPQPSGAVSSELREQQRHRHDGWLPVVLHRNASSEDTDQLQSLLANDEHCQARYDGGLPR